jgi:putative tryptophan/tyrosine transport system substrate-binding protein
MKKSLFLLLCSVLLLLSACGAGSKEAGGEKKEKVVKIGITQIVEHPSLDAAREGFSLLSKMPAMKKERT